MVRQTASLIVLEIIGGVLLLLLVAAIVLGIRLAAGPIELGFLKDDIQAQLTASRSGRPVKLGDVFLEWSREDGRLLVTANRIELLGADSAALATADRAEIAVSGGTLIGRKPEILRLHLESGFVFIDQIGPAQWAVGGEPLPEFKTAKMPDTPSEWLARANEILPSWLVALSDAEAKFKLERVSIEAFEVRVRNQALAPVFSLGNAKGELARTRDGVLLNIAGNGEGLGLPSGLGASLETSERGEKLHANFAVADWPLADLAKRFKLAAGKIDGLPADVDLTINLVKSKGVETVTFVADAGAGKLPFGAAGLPVKDLKLNATYSATNDQLTVKASTTDAAVIDGGATIVLTNALKKDGLRGFTLDSPALLLDLTPRFEGAFPLTGVKATGNIDLSTRAVSDLDFAFSSNGAVFSIKGNLAPVEKRVDKEPPLTGVLDVTATGAINAKSVAAFWPVTLGTGARDFLQQNIEGGDISDLKGRIDLKRDSFAEGFLRDEDLEVTFTTRNTNVRFLSDMPPVQNATGRGRLTGNSFKIVLDAGRFSRWMIDDGVVDFPKLNPKGHDFRVFARGQGPISDVVGVLSKSRFKIKFDAERLTGDAAGTFELFQPALSDVPVERVRYTAMGESKNAGLKKAAFDLDLVKGNAKVDLNTKGITIAGFGDLGDSPVQFTWRDDFGTANTASMLSATSVVTPDMLNRLGFLGRTYLTGEAPMEIQAAIADDKLLSADVDVDLTASRLDVSEVGWVKPKGKAGKMSVRYTRDGANATSKVQFTSEQARLDGDFTLGADSKLLGATLRRAYIKNKADVNGTVTRAKNDQLNVALKGTYLDLAGYFPAIGGGAAVKAPADARKRSPMTVSAKIDTLALRPGLDMRKADVTVVNNTIGMQTFNAKGLADDGSALEAVYDARGASAATLRIKSANAGFMTKAILEADFLEGGEMVLNGTLPKNGAAAKFDIEVTNGRLRDAPFLTQVLSLASLRGLADTLGGEGVLFSKINVPLTVSGGRYIVEGAKAQGPALGMTANGYIESKSGKIEVDGVLVPSFGVNSALGGIPIIGDLVVGRDGEGVFSLTYGVNGTLKKANVSVNPLSALAPGVIRRIFENPTDTRIPEAKKRPPTEPPPPELPPIPEQ